MRNRLNPDYDTVGIYAFIVRRQYGQLSVQGLLKYSSSSAVVLLQLAHSICRCHHSVCKYAIFNIPINSFTEIPYASQLSLFRVVIPARGRLVKPQALFHTSTAFVTFPYSSYMHHVNGWERTKWQCYRCVCIEIGRKWQWTKTSTFIDSLGTYLSFLRDS